MGWGGTPARRGVPGGPGMESLGTALVLLVQFWGATGLRVQQEPEWLRAAPGSRVTLACQVLQSQVWERLRVGWVKDSVSLCEPHITNGSLSLEACGPRGRLSWTPPGNLTLRLDHVSPNDSGDYVCSVAVEIPSLNRKRGNGTQLLVEKEGWRLDSKVPPRHRLLPCRWRVPVPDLHRRRTPGGAAGGRGRGRGRHRAERLGVGPLSQPARGLSLLAPSSAWPRSLAPAPGRVTLYLLPASPLTHAPRGSRGQEGSLKWEDDSKPQKRPPPTNGHVKM
ncbi:transmembrane and immunoglobulin domain-containing protein 2 isoform X3 [Mustela erminea]|uniref:transmembrane and immunoglobulin domain-containing protein 2 isoform X3 n=1 Tax=Mustela erminea TaxID=36723 RepID=UPI0013871B50|nr:transmembrane and immunoglobulin domain-containing protein 2 isoform X3 [Mustela erminea]